MTTFNEANQVRLALKMKLSNYCWYSASAVFNGPNGYYVVVVVKRPINKIRRYIPSTKGVVVKLELEN